MNPKSRILSALSASSAIFLFCLIAPAAESPLVIPFQGQVTNQQNAVVADGQYSLIFNLYDVAVGGQPLWTERHSKVGVVNGMVNLFLGSIVSIAGVDFSQTRYLGITVDVDDKPTTPDPEMVPREMIIPAFYAKQAENSAALAGQTWAAVFSNGNPDTGSFIETKLPQISASRLAADAARDNLIAGGQSPVASGGVILSEDANNAELIAAGYQRIGSIEVGNNIEKLPQNPLTKRVNAFTAWTGSELIIWGGGNEVSGTNSGANTFYNDGARFNIGNRTWSLITTTNAPSGRGTTTTREGLTVWTGNRFLVWGGFDNNSVGTGGLYNPDTNTWTPIETIGAPTPRFAHVAAWTGSKYLVWGGEHRTGGTTVAFLANGGIYDPVANTWTAMPATGAPIARAYPCGVWTGTKWFVWGGSSSFSPSFTPLGDGALFDPAADPSSAWTSISNSGAPSPRWSASAVWTGTEVIVWGGTNGTTTPLAGARYNPVTDTWTAISNPPFAFELGRTGGMMVHWTGDVLIISGGADTTQASEGSQAVNKTAFYNPANDSWERGPDLPLPLVRSSSVWCPGLAGGVHFFGDRNQVSNGDGDLSAETWLVRPPPQLVHLYVRP